MHLHWLIWIGFYFHNIQSNCISVSIWQSFFLLLLLLLFFFFGANPWLLPFLIFISFSFLVILHSLRRETTCFPCWNKNTFAWRCTLINKTWTAMVITRQFGLKCVKCACTSRPMIVCIKHSVFAQAETTMWWDGFSFVYFFSALPFWWCRCFENQWCFIGSNIRKTIVWLSSCFFFLPSHSILVDEFKISGTFSS